MDFVRQLVTMFPGLTSGRLHAMAGDVWERADSLEKWSEPEDYDSEEERQGHIQRLRESARILGLLANALEEVEAAGGALKVTAEQRAEG